MAGARADVIPERCTSTQFRDDVSPDPGSGARDRRQVARRRKCSGSSAIIAGAPSVATMPATLVAPSSVVRTTQGSTRIRAVRRSPSSSLEGGWRLAREGGGHIGRRAIGARIAYSEDQPRGQDRRGRRTGRLGHAQMHDNLLSKVWGAAARNLTSIAFPDVSWRIELSTFPLLGSPLPRFRFQRGNSRGFRTAG